MRSSSTGYSNFCTCLTLHGNSSVNNIETITMGIADQRYQIAGHVTVVMPNSDAKNDTGRKIEATTERNCELSDCTAF